MATFKGKEGVWRTVGGRRIFIAEGESLATAMRKSGKFKKLNDDEFNKKYEIFEDDFYKEWNEAGHNFDNKYVWGESKRLSVKDKKNGKIIGYVKWDEVHNFDETSYQDKVNVIMIKVEEGYRRQGIATKLYQELQKVAGDNEINFGEVTKDGLKLLKSIAEIHPTYDNKHYKGKINMNL